MPIPLPGFYLNITETEVSKVTELKCMHDIGYYAMMNIFETLAMIRICCPCRKPKIYYRVYKTLGEILTCIRYTKSAPTYLICLKVIFKLGPYCGLGLPSGHIHSSPSTLSEPLISSSLSQKPYYYYYYYYYYASHYVLFISFCSSCLSRSKCSLQHSDPKCSPQHSDPRCSPQHSDPKCSPQHSDPKCSPQHSDPKYPQSYSISSSFTNYLKINYTGTKPESNS
jgi:hypothetical protein